ncbi:MAG TPA: DNA translocase FtsK [Candidatus Faecalibacterium faecipullorum]|uniref:DNA translocase FtsK n=1 Tax=Candidatus Faecalibacterium faecipullorum TaxID=2838578 RepID=A0A9D2S8A4_9FIRM|nr:DNA translocase FtsK [Candidatus Faecalibacterium faecipullorum]
MAKRKRKPAPRGRARRARQEDRRRLLVSSATLFAGLVVLLLAFVEGQAAWHAAHDILFGVFGAGSFVLGPAICYMAVLAAREEPVAPCVGRLGLGLAFLSGAAVAFSDIPADLSFAEMGLACYQNGVSAWFGGGSMGGLLGGTLLLLCGRPAANLIIVALAACASCYVFDVTPAELWQWVSGAAASAQEKGRAAREEHLALRAARQAEREAERAAAEEEEARAVAEAEEEEARRMQQMQSAQETEDEPLPLPDGQDPAGRRFGMPAWLARVFGHGRLPDENGDTAAPARPESPLQSAAVSHPRAPFDIDLGPDPAAVTDGGSEPIEPIITGPGGTFGLNPLRRDEAAPAAPHAPLYDQDNDSASAPAAQPAVQTPVRPPEPDRPRDGDDGWIRIEEDTPAPAGDIDALAAAAMEKPADAEQAAAAAPAAAEAEPAGAPYTYDYPPIELFDKSPEEADEGAAAELKANAQKLVDTLESFGVKTRVLDISRGPAVTRYEVQPMAGVKISRITSLADDLALNLAVADIRMEAPIPGKPAVGIEVPNRKRSAVSIRSIFESQSFRRMTSPLTLALGKDIAGVAQVADLCKMPHLLIAGSTGSGKSVCVNSIIMSLVFRSGPEDVKMILIDPKVVELAEYNGIPHLLMPVVTEPKKAAGALSSAVAEMERRYRLFADNNVRDIKTFNKLAASDPMLEKLPYIAIVIDELADLMMVVGKDVEDSICRIAQKARAAGMHLIVATQRPSVDVITGLIKANIPSRIAFAVSSQVDSRTILDGAGAEKLLGMGDMLFMPVGAPKPIRIQGTYVTDEEISRVLTFIKASGTVQYDEAMIRAMEEHAVQDKNGRSDADDDADGAEDPMLKAAVEVVIDAGQASTSLLQRRCKLGYARAARIMDEMEQKGIIGPYEGAKPRAVLISRQQWLEMCMNAPDDTP